MGKQGSPKSPRPESKNDNKIMSPEMKDQILNDHSIGRRNSGGDYHCFSNSKTSSFHGFIKNTSSNNNYNLTNKSKNINNVVKKNNNNIWLRKHLKSIVLTFVFVGFLFLLDSLMVSIFDLASLQRGFSPRRTSLIKNTGREKSPVTMHNWLLKMAYSALIQKELNEESSNLWKEPNRQASSWKPCSDKKHPMNPGTGKDNVVNNGYILISANGGLNQQRVAICNAVAVASLLNATLVLPTFLYSSVWKDPSQFGDIYQEKHFIEVLKDEIKVIKEIPHDLKSIDIEAIGSLITDADLPKEATPIDYMKIALPRLLQNKIVHFMGFGNRLGFDPLPFELQRLRCKCNFHALKFVPKIQKAGSVLVQRIRNYDAQRSELDKQLLGDFMPKIPQNVREISETKPSKYLALHLRFEIDMVAYSLCEFGGGEAEKNELRDYREIHFPLLVERLKSSKLVSPKELRDLGKCPLTPEEAGLVLAGLGFRHGTYIYLAGSHIYGGKSRMSSFKKLYPNLVTKETLLTPSELAPFQNFSSRLAALDFIACATADVFAMTDSGSQLSSLASGFRTYYGNGKAPNLRPNKKRLASILSESETIKWSSFEERVKKMIEEGQRVSVRSFGKSIYRQPRCSQCMCKI